MYYIPASAKWTKDLKNNWSWIEDQGKAIGWKEIDSEWYYFNSDGVMNTGWLNYNGDWYNLSSSGIMDKGWKEIDGKWYYFNLDGKMVTGWINDNGTWYYTDSNGEMQTGTLEIDGKDYTFSESGVMTDDNEITQETQTGAADVSNVKTNSDSRVGYVSTNSDSLNIRSDATISSDILGSLAKYSEVKIIGDEKNGFYPIISNGQKGWVSSQWISFEQPKDISASTSSYDDSNINTSQINNSNLNLTNASLGSIRDTQPDLDDKHYYSDDNIFYKVRLSPPFFNRGKLIKGNCTWYAWGRAWEITGVKPTDAGFIGNGYEWWGANQSSGKYQYGSEPRVGAIAVWKSSLPNSGGSGHVAVVEKIQDDKVYISESTWNGVVFRYREIYGTDYLYGYIYLDKPNY
jgi:hypothetical protein